MPYPAPPDFFLTIAASDLTLDPTLSALCAGYTGTKWRGEALAEHAMEWLPEFCLTADELNQLKPGNALRLIRKAAGLVYQTDKYKHRGEFGELFLHIALRQIYQSVPAISKMYWKDSVNGTVKGYDAVHVVEVGGKLELWIGEVKFYDNATRAVRDVAKEILDHTRINYMENEVALIANKLDKSSPHYQKLSKLLHKNTSIDDVFDAACVPVLITYDSTALKNHTKTTAQYVQALKAEANSIQAKLSAKLKPMNLPVRVHLFVIPLNSKASLVKQLDGELKRLQ
jgi:hypothetical protein